MMTYLRSDRSLPAWMVDDNRKYDVIEMVHVRLLIDVTFSQCMKDQLRNLKLQDELFLTSVCQIDFRIDIMLILHQVYLDTFLCI